jgi:hypothetical protein
LLHPAQAPLIAKGVQSTPFRERGEEEDQTARRFVFLLYRTSFVACGPPATGHATDLPLCDYT